MKNTESAISIGVLGAGQADAPLYGAARSLGAAIGNRGWWLVCGGLSGVMEGACRGAREAGGHTVGIIPGARRGEANPWVELVIVSGLGDARNTLIARTAHACVALPGSYGTLSEIAFCLKFGTPVVGMECSGSGRIPYAGIESVNSPDEACEWLEGRLQETNR
jgi:uncharacterized protein (TIGR00725 family)